MIYQQLNDRLAVLIDRDPWDFRGQHAVWLMHSHDDGNPEHRAPDLFIDHAAYQSDPIAAVIHNLTILADQGVLPAF